MVKGRRLGAEPAAEQALLDPEVERAAPLRLQVRVALGEERDAEGLEEARLLDPGPRAGAERGRVGGAAQPPRDGRPRHRARAEAGVVLDAGARGHEQAIADDEPVLRVGPDVGAARREQWLGARAQGTRLPLEVGAGGQQVPAARPAFGLITEREPPDVVLEAGGVAEVGDRERAHAVAEARHVRPGVDRIEVPLVAQRVAGADLVREPVARAQEPASDDDEVPLDRRVEVRTAVERLAGRARRARGSAGDEAQRGTIAEAHTECGRARRLPERAVGLLVVGLDAQRAGRPVEAAATSPAFTLEAPAAEASPLGRRLEGLSFAGRGVARDEVDDAGESVGAVEAARRAAHHLDLLERQRQQRAEVERAAGLVEGHAVDHHAGRVGGPAAQEQRALPAEASRAGHCRSRHLLEQMEYVGAGALVDALVIEHRRGHSECRERGLGAGGGDQHVFAHGSGGEDEVEILLGGPDDPVWLRRQHETRRFDAHSIFARSEPGDVVSALGARDGGALADGAGHDQQQLGDGSALGGADPAGESAGGLAPRGRAGDQEKDGCQAGEEWTIHDEQLLQARSLSDVTVRAGFLAPGSSPCLRPSPGPTRVAAP